MKNTTEVTFKRCLETIKEIYSDDGIGWLDKGGSVQQVLSAYFTGEDLRDVFEGFCRLMHLCEKYAFELRGSTDYQMAHIVLDSFHSFITSPNLSAEDVDNVLEAVPAPEVYNRAVEIASKFSRRHLDKISTVFRLKAEGKTDYLVERILAMIKAGEVVKAVEWICHFDLRKQPLFEENSNENVTLFKEMVCTLVLAGRDDVLIELVGPDIYRQKELVRYLDKLVGMLLSRFVGNTPLEEKLLGTERKAEKAAKRFFDRYNFGEELIPNLLNLRARDALMYHHYRREHGDITQEAFEEIALQAMKKSVYTRNYYIAHLAGRRCQRAALYFAIYTGMRAENYPDDLRMYVADRPDIDAVIRDLVARSKEQKRQVVLSGGCGKNYLFGKYPIVMIEDMRGVHRLCETITREEVIGVDTEWKPTFESMREQMAIIQVATPAEVFIIDVVLLESRITQDQWMRLFAALLCSKTKKIGFALSNDFRVMRSHFPFLVDLADKVKNVICLQKLLGEVNNTPEARERLFEGKSADVLVANSLHEVSKIFAGIELNKGEREGNWMRRPLSSEQLEYAALDAYCLLQCFDEISVRLSQVNDNDLRRRLKEVSLVTFPMETRRNSEAHAKQPKEKETPTEFVEGIQAITREMDKKAEESGVTPGRVADFKLVIDSMFFGLGERLRKCGFDVKLIGNRIQLVQFCFANPEFTVISTGKAFKEIQLQLPAGRCVCLPYDCEGSQVGLRQISHLCRQLNIAIRPEDMFSRCQKCNQRSTFATIPRRLFKVFFLDYVITNHCDWMMPDMKEAEKAYEMASSELYDNSLPPNCGAIVDDDDYSISVGPHSIICHCKGCVIDVANQLVQHQDSVSPVQLKISKGIRWSDVSGEVEDVGYEMCTQCGRLNRRNFF